MRFVINLLLLFICTLSYSQEKFNLRKVNDTVFLLIDNKVCDKLTRGIAAKDLGFDGPEIIDDFVILVNYSFTNTYNLNINSILVTRWEVEDNKFVIKGKVRFDTSYCDYFNEFRVFFERKGFRYSFKKKKGFVRYSRMNEKKVNINCE